MSNSLSSNLISNGKVTDKELSSWFDSPYYHILYKGRSFDEAKFFMDNLTQYLNIEKKSEVLDLACGRGRHSIYLNQLGYKVLGIDLSLNSITTAKAHEKEGLKFEVHDMRLPLNQKFDAIFNLFTSFGYFDDKKDNVKILNAIKESLSSKGFAVIDFMNVHKVLLNLVAKEIKTIDQIDFHIKRYHLDNFIYKEINFNHNGNKFHFTEKVTAFTLKDLQEMIESTGMHVLDIFGDYQLNRFNEKESERVILIFK